MQQAGGAVCCHEKSSCSHVRATKLAYLLDALGRPTGGPGYFLVPGCPTYPRLYSELPETSQLKVLLMNYVFCTIVETATSIIGQATRR